MLAERGLIISYETVRRWFLKFDRPSPPIHAAPAPTTDVEGTSNRIASGGKDLFRERLDAIIDLRHPLWRLT